MNKSTNIIINQSLTTFTIKMNNLHIKAFRDIKSFLIFFEIILPKSDSISLKNAVGKHTGGENIARNKRDCRFAVTLFGGGTIFVYFCDIRLVGALNRSY